MWLIAVGIKTIPLCDRLDDVDQRTWRHDGDDRPDAVLQPERDGVFGDEVLCHEGIVGPHLEL